MFKRTAFWRSQCRALRPRRYSYQYNQYHIPPPQSSWGKRLLAGASAVGAIAGLYYFYWPKHSFPSPVAKVLRKGLWAESDKGEYDYQLALKYYLEALKVYEELGVDKISDEYTGVQLKIGEMFERLNMLDDANFLYNEIAANYLKVLTDPKFLNNPINTDQKYHLIQKDLRVAIKLSELSKANPTLSKAILFTHSIIATDEIEKFLGVKLGDIKNDFISDKRLDIALPFLDEYINLMSVLITNNIMLEDISFATDLNIKLNKLMLVSNIEPKKVLLSQCNLGSLLYLQSEVFELKMVNLLKKYNASIQDVDVDKVDTSVFNAEDLNLYNKFAFSRSKCIELSIDSYENVLKVSNNLASKVNPSDANLVEINEIISLSTYSLGVINLHQRNFDKSERLLRESRVKSKQCNYEELLGEIERELSKLFEEKKLLKAQAKDVSPE